MEVEWEKANIQELDITATDLSTECLIDMLSRIPGLRFLSAGQLNGFNDSVIIIINNYFLCFLMYYFVRNLYVSYYYNAF